MSLWKTSTDSNKPTRAYSSKQEKDLANKYNGKQTVNSGATLFAKGDVSLENMLVECKTKTTPSESISIKKEWLEKVKKESLFEGKPYYALAFNFGPNESNYYIIDDTLFSILVDR